MRACSAYRGEFGVITSILATFFTLKYAGNGSAGWIAPLATSIQCGFREYQHRMGQAAAVQSA
jgi:hypothetical protein